MSRSESEDDAACGMLSRWSRRKRAARGQADGGLSDRAASTVPDQAVANDPVELAERRAGDPLGQEPRAEALSGVPLRTGSVGSQDVPQCRVEEVGEASPQMPYLELPSLESLGPGSDLRPFLRPGVAPALRNAALRRMWTVDPAIRDYIGPADYAWDWNTPGGVPDYAETLSIDPERIRQTLAGMFGPRETDPARPAEPLLEHEVDAVLAQAPAVPGPSGRVGLVESAADAGIVPARTDDGGTPSDAADPDLVDKARDDAPPPGRHGGAVPRVV